LNSFKINEIEQSKITANEFQDISIGHYGKSNPWPKFEESKK